MRFLLFFLFLCTIAKADIEVKGNQSVSAEKILMLIEFFNLDDAKENIYSSGLFENVELYENQGNYIVKVEEKKIISQVFFMVDGDKKSKGDLGPSYEQLIQVSKLTPGILFDEQKILIAKSNLKGFYYAQNYANAEIKYELLPYKDNADAKNSTYTLYIHINRGEKYAIDEVVFIGLKELSSDELKKHITPRIKNYFLFTTSSPEPLNLNQDFQELEECARDQGFLKAQVKNSFVETVRNANNDLIQKIYINFDEGPICKFRKIDIEVDGVQKQPINQKLKGKANEYKIYEYSQIIRKKYKDCGNNVAVRVEKTIEGDEVDIKYYVKPINLQNVISKIVVKGNSTTKSNVILRASKLTVGSYFDNSTLASAEHRIRNLGFFKFVNVQSTFDQLFNAYLITIYVEDTPSGQIGLQGAMSFGSEGFKNIDYSLNLFYQHPNFLGNGNELMFNLSIGKGLEVGTAYKRRNIFNRDIDWLISGMMFSSGSSDEFIRHSGIDDSVCKKDTPLDQQNKIALKGVNNLSSLTKTKKIGHSGIDDSVQKKDTPIDPKKKVPLKDNSTTVAYVKKVKNIKSGFIFDLFDYGSLKTMLNIENQNFKYSAFEDEKNISRFFETDWFPKERNLFEFIFTHSFGKSYHSKQNFSFNHNMTIGLDGKSKYIKYEPHIKFYHPINRSQSIYLINSISYGYMQPLSEQYYWVDHFDKNEIYMRGFNNLGPVERNRYTSIGGTNKFNAYSELIMPFILPTKMVTSFIGIYAGSVWGSSMPNNPILKQYANYRNWKDDTLDIGGKDFALKSSVAAGIKVAIGPIKLEWSWHAILLKNKETDETCKFQFKLYM